MWTKPYTIVLRARGTKRGETIDQASTMEEARAACDFFMPFLSEGTVLIIYLHCPSMPLDARYYVKHEGKVYQSRARVYNKEYLAWRKANTVDHDVPRPLESYTAKWLEVRRLVTLYHNSPKEA